MFCSPVSPPKSYSSARSLNSTTATTFSNTFILSQSPTISVAIFTCSDIEELVTLFNASCLETLDCVAPLKQKRVKTITTPWLNAITRSVRKSCSKAKRKWKKEKLQVFYDIFRDSLNIYQNSVKTAKVEYYAQLINNNAHRPKVLFNTINSILNPASIYFK